MVPIKSIDEREKWEAVDVASFIVLFLECKHPSKALATSETLYFPFIAKAIQFWFQPRHKIGESHFQEDVRGLTRVLNTFQFLVPLLGITPAKNCGSPIKSNPTLVASKCDVHKRNYCLMSMSTIYNSIPLFTRIQFTFNFRLWTPIPQGLSNNVCSKNTRHFHQGHFDCPVRYSHSLAQPWVLKWTIQESHVTVHAGFRKRLDVHNWNDRMNVYNFLVFTFHYVLQYRIQRSLAISYHNFRAHGVLHTAFQCMFG